MQTVNDSYLSSPAKNLVEHILDFEKLGFPPELTDTLQKVVTKASQHMTQKVVQFLHDDLDDTKHTEDQVKTVIEAFPEALTLKDKNRQIPVQTLLTPNKVSFIPILAQVGELCNVMGKDSRGGLLRKSLPLPTTGRDAKGVRGPPGYAHSYNLLQRLSKAQFGVADEEKLFTVLKKLKSMGLIHKEDITKYKLLDPLHMCQFKFFTAWNPNWLKEARWNGTDMPYLNAIARSRSPRASMAFRNFLKMSMRYFPQELGLIFQKYEEEIDALQDAFNNFGRKETMGIIKRCMPLSDAYPILHIVHDLAPKYVEIFSAYYPDATYMTDSKNQTLFQSMLASGKKNFADHPTFFLQASDEQLAVKDPVTDLFPFAHAASNDTSDLTAVYILLKRDPTLIWGERSSTEKIIHKRKREIVQKEAARKKVKMELVTNVKQESVKEVKRELMVFI